MSTSQSNQKYTIHRASERGVATHRWLESRFSFSFAQYYNPNRMGFGSLRVINDDIVEPSQGFGMHPHRDMEIVSIVMEGTLEHKDSMNNHGAIHAGEIQYMSAGSGILHSEYNPSNECQVKFFQIWIQPNIFNAQPLYEKKSIAMLDKTNQWVCIVSPKAGENSIKIRQNASIWLTDLSEGEKLSLPKNEEKYKFLLFVIEGEVMLFSEVLTSRDEMQILDGVADEITAQKNSKLMLFGVL